MKKVMIRCIAIGASLVASLAVTVHRSHVTMSDVSQNEYFRNEPQEAKMAMPMVSFAGVPLYPPLARVSNVEGTIHVVVTTDGHKVIVATAEKNSNRILARAAETNALTWQFAIHEPMTFTITYRYKLVDDIDAVQNNPRVILRLPTDVEVDARRFPSTVDMPAKVIPE